MGKLGTLAAIKRAIIAAKDYTATQISELAGTVQQLYEDIGSDLTAHIADKVVHITSSERNAWNAKQPAGNYLTKETDPTVPAWAKAATKPAYTAAEIGAQPSITAQGVLKGTGASVVPAVAGTDYAAAPRTVTVTLLANGWGSEIISDSSTSIRVADPGKTFVAVQTVSVAGITENSTAIVSLAPTDSMDVMQAAAAAMLQASAQGAGTISIRAYAFSHAAASEVGHPEIDIPIQVTIL